MTPADATCIALLATLPTAGPSPFWTCVEVYETAQRHGQDPVHTVAQAWVESRINPDAVSPDGCVGPLQIQPRYKAAFCAELGLEQCTDIEAGIGARKRWKRKRGSNWACHYASGNVCTEAGRRYVRRVAGVAGRLRNG